ncbi:hypothetical protein CDAR_572021 [Caerostris darwini]|uniref:Uncharacterized protein n=1 Tax=Caerostris darwini TaxID=1538125 RepID=A0AAV4MV33_9ARAC|nr:hypothetical protein CDAR_572021 [Caerostris darwini]
MDFSVVKDIDSFTHLSERVPRKTSITPSENLWHDPYRPPLERPDRICPFSNAVDRRTLLPPPTLKKILLAVDDYWPGANQDVRPPQEDGAQSSFLGANAPGKVFFGALSLLSLEGIDKWDYWEEGERSPHGSIRCVWDKEDGNQRHAERR